MTSVLHVILYLAWLHSARAEGDDTSTWERLKQMEEEVRRQEALLGENHPQVGKQWLYLSRAYQNEDPRQYSEKAERALVRCSPLPLILSSHAYISPHLGKFAIQDTKTHKHTCEVLSCHLPALTGNRL